jgi:hypothetical protein
MQQVLELLKWNPSVCGVMRAVCSTWSSLHDTLRPGRLNPRRSLAVMVGKLSWFPSVTKVERRLWSTGGAAEHAVAPQT